MLQIRTVYLFSTHNIADFDIRPGFAYNVVTRFTVNVKTNKDSFSLDASGGSGMLIGGSTKEATEKACKDFAEKLSGYLKK